MIKIAFCDDDLSALDEIKTLLEQYREKCSQSIIYKAFRSPLELLEEVESGLSPDILLLDVMMPGEDGISTTREIRQYNSTVKVIFLTSSSEFAVDSYTVGAYAYQMKPICAQDLFRVLDSAIGDCQNEQQDGIVVRCSTGITRIPLDKLAYCEVIGRELRFYLMDGRVLESKGSMEKLWARLEKHGGFVRPHRSFLVHMRYIQSISSKSITMENQNEIPIPHGKCTKIREQYLAYAFDKKQVLMI